MANLRNAAVSAQWDKILESLSNNDVFRAFEHGNLKGEDLSALPWPRKGTQAHEILLQKLRAAVGDPEFQPSFFGNWNRVRNEQGWEPEESFAYGVPMDRIPPPWLLRDIYKAAGGSNALRVRRRAQKILNIEPRLPFSNAPENWSPKTAPEQWNADHWRHLWNSAPAANLLQLMMPVRKWHNILTSKPVGDRSVYLARIFVDGKFGELPVAGISSPPKWFSRAWIADVRRKDAKLADKLEDKIIDLWFYHNGNENGNAKTNNTQAYQTLFVEPEVLHGMKRLPGKSNEFNLPISRQPSNNVNLKIRTPRNTVPPSLRGRLELLSQNEQVDAGCLLERYQRVR